MCGERDGTEREMWEREMVTVSVWEREMDRTREINC